MSAARRPSLPRRRARRSSALPTSLRPIAALGAAVVLAAATVTPVGPAAAIGPTCGEFTGGVHVVQTEGHLAAIGSGNAGEDCDPARTYRLANSITVAARDSALVAPVFTGTLDGNDHTITLDIDRTSEGWSLVGLFASVDGATFTDLTLDGSVRMAHFGSVGALAGSVSGATTITGLTSFVDVAGRSDVGGLVGLVNFDAVLSVSSVQVGTSANPVEVRATRQAGGLVGAAFGGIVVGLTEVHVSAEAVVESGFDHSYFGGLFGYLNAVDADVTIDGSAASTPHGVSVSFALLAPGRDVNLVGGLAGNLGADDLVIRGVAVELDVDTAGASLGGIAGVLAAQSTTIGGARTEDAVLIAGSIVGVDALGSRVAGITPFNLMESDGTSIRGLTMAASITGNEVGGLYANVNGTLHVEDTVVSGPVEGFSAGGIADSFSSAVLSLRNVVIASDIRADQVGGIAAFGGPATVTIDGVQVTGRLRLRAATTDGFRGVAGLFLVLNEVTFTAPPTFSAADATIEADFPEGLAVGDAFLRAAGLVGSLGNDIDAATLAGAAPTMTITVSDALRDSGRCLVASRFIWSSGPEAFVRIDPLSPDPCPRGTSTSDVGDTAGSGTGPAIELACTWPQLAVGAQVTCTVRGGPVDAELLWHALVNPVVAGGAVVLDGAGAGTFTFTVPRTALGQPLAVELVEWRAPVLLGTVTAAVPTGVPAGLGGDARGGIVGGGAGVASALVLLLAGALVLRADRSRRRMTAG